MSVTHEGTEAKPPARSKRFVEIDVLKGLAILGVLLIHARPLVGTAFHTYVINRAVPVFIFLFGVNSQLWWQKHGGSWSLPTLREWYWGRLKRLMVPVWGAMFCWWGFALFFRPDVRVSLTKILATAIGYAPWVGTAWFITLIIELVLLFPLILLAMNHVGKTIALVLTVISAAATYYFAGLIMTAGATLLGDVSPLFYLSIFPGGFLPLVVAGMILARTRVRIGVPIFGLCAMLLIGGILVHQSGVLNQTWQLLLMRILDIFLSIVLLMAARGIALWLPLRRFLIWCGISSWGIYIGQMLVHNAFTGAGIRPPLLTHPEAWLYASALFIGSVGFVTVGETVRTLPLRQWLAFERTV